MPAPMIMIFFAGTVAVMIGTRASETPAIAIVLCAEQWVTGLPSFQTLPWETDVQELTDLMSTGGDVAYVEYYAPRNHADWVAMEISAMWAGMQANKPVVNGYSGAWPAGYDPRRLMQPHEMANWLARSKSPPAPAAASGDRMF